MDARIVSVDVATQHMEVEYAGGVRVNVPLCPEKERMEEHLFRFAPREQPPVDVDVDALIGTTWELSPPAPSHANGNRTSLLGTAPGTHMRNFGPLRESPNVMDQIQAMWQLLAHGDGQPLQHVKRTLANDPE